MKKRFWYIYGYMMAKWSLATQLPGSMMAAKYLARTLEKV